MVTYSVNVGVQMDRFAVAEQVISSAGNILIAAGFDTEEIEALFRQAADQLGSGEAVVQNGDNYSAEPDAIDADSIRSDFEETAPVKALAKLKTRADAMDRPNESPETLKKCLALASKMLPHIAEAQAWLRDTAVEAGITIIANRDKWIETATDEELDKEYEYIFLDDLHFSYGLNLDFLDRVADALVDQGDAGAFDQFYDMLVESKIAVSSELKETMEKGAETLAFKGTFVDWVLGQSEEVAETQFLEDFVKQHEFPQPSYFLVGWVRELEAQGKIARYKRANRWRIDVIGR